MKEYTLISNNPISKDIIRKHFDEHPLTYKLPCKITIVYGSESKSFYIEESNFHKGVMVVNWSNIAEWGYQGRVS